MKRETANFLVAGPLAKHVAGTRPLTKKERRSLLNLIYFACFSWLYQMYKTTKLEEETTDLSLNNERQVDELKDAMRREGDLPGITVQFDAADSPVFTSVLKADSWWHDKHHNLDDPNCCYIGSEVNR